jgi:hypothetical protein
MSVERPEPLQESRAVYNVVHRVMTLEVLNDAIIKKSPEKKLRERRPENLHEVSRVKACSDNLIKQKSLSVRVHRLTAKPRAADECNVLASYEKG